jgi:hypothetical protein
MWQHMGTQNITHDDVFEKRLFRSDLIFSGCLSVLIDPSCSLLCQGQDYQVVGNHVMAQDTFTMLSLINCIKVRNNVLLLVSLSPAPAQAQPLGQAKVAIISAYSSSFLC